MHESEGPSDHESDDSREALERVLDFEEKKAREKAERIVTKQREKAAAAKTKKGKELELADAVLSASEGWGTDERRYGSAAPQVRWPPPR